MFVKMLKAKIHRVVVTNVDLNYSGSITIDQDLMDAAGLLQNQAVLVADINNGTRHETYAIAGERGSGTICVNGAAARLVSVGDLILVLCFLYVPVDQAAAHRSKLVLVDQQNRITEVLER